MCSRSSWALIQLVIECTFVLVWDFAFAMFNDLELIWGLHPGSSAVYRAKTEQLHRVVPLYVRVYVFTHTCIIFLSSSFFPSSFSIWFCFAFYLQCVVLLWVLLMHVELRFPEEAVWHWNIKINFFVFCTLKAIYYKLRVLLQGSRMLGRAEIWHCWESLSIKSALVPNGVLITSPPNVYAV